MNTDQVIEVIRILKRCKQIHPAWAEALSSAIQAYEENERLVKENEQISLDIQLYFPFKEIAEKLQAKLDRINEESVEKIASETCENCRAFSSRRLCGVENGSICKEIAKAICKLKE